MTTTTTNIRTRVRIVNYIDGTAKTVETGRDRVDVLIDLMVLVRRVNRRRDETLKACLQIRRDRITLIWYCPHWSTDLAQTILEVVEPIAEAEWIIWRPADSESGTMVPETEKDSDPGRKPR